MGGVTDFCGEARGHLHARCENTCYMLTTGTYRDLENVPNLQKFFVSVSLQALQLPSPALCTRRTPPPHVWLRLRRWPVPHAEKRQHRERLRHRHILFLGTLQGTPGGAGQLCPVQSVHLRTRGSSCLSLTQAQAAAASSVRPPCPSAVDTRARPPWRRPAGMHALWLGQLGVSQTCPRRSDASHGLLGGQQ